MSKPANEYPPRGCVDIIFGPMFSGKTTELIRRIRRYQAIGRSVLVINSALDTRCGAEIRSHDAKVVRAKKVDLLIQDIKQEDLLGVHVVAIDEAQFFPDLVDAVQYLTVLKGIDVIVSGLNGDAKQNKFGYISDLIPIADSVTHLNGLCGVCRDGTLGNFSIRLQGGGEDQLQVGATESYMCVCREHISMNE
jgi:thymidine kinase